MRFEILGDLNGNYRQAMRELGVNDEEYIEMQAEGRLTAKTFDTSAARDLFLRYEALGLDDKAKELLHAVDSSSNFWTAKIAEYTGRDIEYQMSTDHWRDNATGQYVKTPYIGIDCDQYVLYYHILDLYG